LHTPALSYNEPIPLKDNNKITQKNDQQGVFHNWLVRVYSESEAIIQIFTAYLLINPRRANLGLRVNLIHDES
jgi:hypothetical protein